MTTYCNQEQYDAFYGDDHQSDLKARYAVAHAVVMAGNYASLQTDIDDGSVWEMGSGGVTYAMNALNIGAVLAPPNPGTNADGDKVPAYWQLGVGRGSVSQAEAYIAAAEADPDFDA
jgi:hypothetical protein